MSDKEAMEIPIARCKNNLDLSTNKKILIAGANSYIGESFAKYISKYENYTIDFFDTKSNEWEKMDFSKYDVLYYVAGIVHIKETDENRELYYKINKYLTAKVAEKAKKEGVKQFIYLSTMSVYGLLEGTITKDTEVNPKNAYGDSKFQAEQLLWKLNDDKFVVSIIRPPMVYGKGCKGNYQTLRKFALKIHFFPKYDNNRSMIFIDNLCSVIRAIIHNEESGLYFPQNIDYLNTYEMVKVIAEANNKKFYSTKLINFLIKILAKKINIFKKVFGTLTYEKSMNVPKEWICIKENIQTIEMTEN